jgi:integrase
LPRINRREEVMLPETARINPFDIFVSITNVEKFEEDIEKIIPGTLPYYKSILKELHSFNQQNANLLYSFLLREHTERNVKVGTKITYIKIIFHFIKFCGFKDFDRITNEDITNYLNSLRRPEVEDPTHKWIGTHNTRQMILNKFFRWLYNKHEHNKEKWINPECLLGIKSLRRKEKSAYKPSDIWTYEEHSVFLKYCPQKRDQCYHAMANDTSCRPHELLSIRIGDIKFKVSSTGKQYAEVHIADSKTKPRTLPLIFSIPYVKEWIELHPLANNPNSWLFISLSDSTFGKQLTENALYKLYARSYKQKFFPRLLDDPSIEERDKAYLRNLLTKPWAPYIQRHSALTQKSQILKESTLRDHAGWSMNSKMPNVYIHYFGNESSKSLLQAYGIEDYSNKKVSVLKGKTCPNCNESNRQDAKFCIKCRMVLTFDAYSYTLEEQKKKEDEIKRLEEKYETGMKQMKEDVEKKLQQILMKIDTNKICV